MKEEDAIKKICPMVSLFTPKNSMSLHEDFFVNCKGNQCAVWDSWEWTQKSQPYTVHRKGQGECGLISKPMET